MTFAIPGSLCVYYKYNKFCTAGFFELEDNCVLQCPNGYAASEDGRYCELCNGPCRKGMYTQPSLVFVWTMRGE